MSTIQTTVFIKFRPSAIKGKEGSIYFQFIRKRKVKVITSPYKIYPEEWNEELSTIRIGTFSSQRERRLQEIYLEVKQDEEKIRRKIYQLEKKGDYSLSDLARFYRNQAPNVSEFVEELAVELGQRKQYRLIEAYRVTSNKLIALILYFCTRRAKK